MYCDVTADQDYGCAPPPNFVLYGYARNDRMEILICEAGNILFDVTVIHELVHVALQTYDNFPGCSYWLCTDCPNCTDKKLSASAWTGYNLDTVYLAERYPGYAVKHADSYGLFARFFDENGCCPVCQYEETQEPFAILLDSHGQAIIDAKSLVLHVNDNQPGCRLPLVADPVSVSCSDFIAQRNSGGSIEVHVTSTQGDFPGAISCTDRIVILDPLNVCCVQGVTSDLCPICTVDNATNCPHSLVPCLVPKCLLGQCALIKQPFCCTNDRDCPQSTTCYSHSCVNGTCVSNTNPSCVTGSTCPACAVGHGDPHFRTFDGFRFNYHGCGDYILTQSLKFSLHARFLPRVPGDHVTYVNSIALHKTGGHVAAYSCNRDCAFYVNGVKVVHPTTDSPLLFGGGNVTVVPQAYSGSVTMYQVSRDGFLVLCWSLY